MKNIENLNKLEEGRLLVGGYNYTLTQLDGQKIPGLIYRGFNNGTNSYEFSRNFLPKVKEIISIKKRDLIDESKNRIIIKGEYDIKLEQICKKC